MLTLITYPAGFNEPSLSPFCVKTMIQLDMAGEDWQPEYTDNPSNAPLGRLPVLRTPKGQIPESGFIQTYLESRGADFYPGLKNRDCILGHSLIRMIEENLRLALVHDRWLDDRCWPALKAAAFASVPTPIRGPVSAVVRRKIRAGLTSHGIARMDEEQRLQMLQPDLDVLTDLLWEKPFLLGDRPTAPDTSALPVLSMLAGLPANTAIRRAVQGNETLMAYVGRGRAALYPGDTFAKTQMLAA